MVSVIFFFKHPIVSPISMFVKVKNFKILQSNVSLLVRMSPTQTVKALYSVALEEAL